MPRLALLSELPGTYARAHDGPLPTHVFHGLSLQLFCCIGGFKIASSGVHW